MKTILIITLAIFSLGSFAKSEDFRDTAKFQASSAAAAFEMAQDAVVEIKAARYKESLSYLSKCNLRRNQWDDNFFFKRNAWTNSSWVSVNHVTGMYTAIVKVSCTIRKKRD
ncbi:MAG: hypothetical protein K9K67_07305 [Bacteriovoracaceae bacterium]|nr:hypothetical protein [Bacteriovoracaceae bacterium]